VCAGESDRNVGGGPLYDRSSDGASRGLGMRDGGGELRKLNGKLGFKYPSVPHFLRHATAPGETEKSGR
jgi:hypothetical protein